MSSMTETPPLIADAPPGNWVDRHAPATFRPYLKLARFDRPVPALDRYDELLAEVAR